MCSSQSQKTKILVIVFMIIFSMNLLVGCQTNSKDLADPKPPVSQTEEVLAQEITDSEEIEKLWQEYIYHAIATVMNSDEYHSAAEIDPYAIARFCWYKYIAENDLEYLEKNLEFKNDSSTQRLFPLNTAMEYAKRYFNLDTLDKAKFKDHYYDSERNAFTFSLQSKSSIPSHKAKNPWGLVLDKVVKNSDGTITASILSYEHGSNDLIRRITTCILKEREDGSYYFLSGNRKDIDNNLVKLAGSYKNYEGSELIEKINKEEVRILGENSDSVILSTGMKQTPLILFDADTMTVIKELEINVESQYFYARMRGENIAIGLDNKVLLFDKNLEQVADISLPQEIKSNISNENNYGYDISLDFTKIVYADKEGLKVFDRSKNSMKVLIDTIPAEHKYPDYGAGSPSNHYHIAPRFIGNDTKVISTLSGYEGTAGYLVYDLMDESVSKYQNIFEAIYTTDIFSNEGMLIQIFNDYQVEKKETADYEVSYLNFATGEVVKVKKEIPGSLAGFIRFSESVYSGENFAAFLTYSDNMKHSYVNRINLNTMEIEANLLSIEEAQVSILGILADGRIVCRYYRSEAEKGICVTNPADKLIETMVVTEEDNTAEFNWVSLYHQIIAEKYYDTDVDFIIHNLDINNILLGIIPEFIPAPALKQNYDWYLLDFEKDSYQKIKGEYNRILTYEDKLLTAYSDGQDIEVNSFRFPFLHQYNIESKQYNRLQYYAGLATGQDFVIGGVGQRYVLTNVEKNETGWDLHVQSDYEFDGPPKGIISSTNDSVILRFANFTVSNELHELEGIETHWDSVVNTTTINISAAEGTHSYTCEIEKVSGQQWIFRILFK